jgi:hypothetical protein
MKLEEKQNTIKRVGVVDRKTCSMAINAHAFNLLARQYSDPIKAILQELGCNAVDSHKRAGNTDPFLVQLPTKMDQHFRIRDFGTGMDETKIDNVYVNWMESDKRQTNDETGYFGIGSKTPLAYGDSFNITTYTDGIMRLYTMCRNEDDIPELQCYGSSETTEPNGVEISFAVKESDFAAFQSKAKQVYQYFQLKPIVNGDAEFFDEIPVWMSGTDWVFYSKDKFDFPMVVMGGVAYPITYSVKDAIRYVNADIFRFINNAEGLVVEVPIGSLDITPSREALEITARTKQTLIDVFKNVRLEMIKLGEQSLSLANVKDLSDWSYHLRLEKTVREFYNLGVQLLNFERPRPNYPKYYEGDGLFERGYYFVKQNGDVTRHSLSVCRRQSINPASNYRFILAQDIKGMDRRIRAYLESNKDLSIRIIDGVGKRFTKQEAMDFLGFNQTDDLFIDVSQLPVLPKAIRITSSGVSVSRKPRNLLRAKVLGLNGWEECLIDPNGQDYYYVELQRDDVKLPNINEKDFTFQFAPNKQIRLYCQEFGITIIGLRSKDLKSELLKVPTMHDFCAEFGTLIDQHFQQNQNRFISYHFPAQFDEYMRSKGGWDLNRLTDRLEWLQSSFGDEHILTQIAKAKKITQAKPDLWDVWVAHCGITLESLKDHYYQGRLVSEWLKDLKLVCKIYKGIDGTTDNDMLIKAVDFYYSCGKMQLKGE